MDIVNRIRRMIGANTADNGFDSTDVVANPDGSVLERLEEIQTNVDTPRCVSLAQVAANLTGTATKFTITGTVVIKHLGLLVTTAIAEGANTLKFSHKAAGESTGTDLCAATDTASAAKHQLFLVDGVAATNLVKTTAIGVGVAANEHMPIILGPGVIQTIFSAAAPATGAGTLFVQYEPLTPGAKITA